MMPSYAPMSLFRNGFTLGTVTILSQAQFQLDSFEEAKESLIKAAEYAPDSEEINELLQRTIFEIGYCSCVQ